MNLLTGASLLALAKYIYYTFTMINKRFPTRHLVSEDCATGLFQEKFAMGNTPNGEY